MKKTIVIVTSQKELDTSNLENVKQFINECVLK